jgi:hypothetical protein
LSEGECSFEVFGVPGAALAAYLPALGSTHPLNSSIWMESRVLLQTPNGLRADCRYAGAEEANFNIPQYELTISMQEQPIETHPRFVSHLAGTAATPLNGAIFIDPQTGTPGTVNARCVFERFAPVLTGGGKNPKGGLEAFLAPTVTYRQNYVSGSPASGSDFGKISSSVPGPGYPGTTASRDWLMIGSTYQRRGSPAGGTYVVYEVSNEWLLSGPGGWDNDIYY